MDLSELRTRLQEITHTDSINEHPLAIEALRLEFPLTIRLISFADPTLPQNCFEWALDLCHELAHWVAEWGLPDLFVGSKFVQELIPYLTPVPKSDVTEGDLVVYVEEEMPIHAGLIKESKVISKWGRGHIYLHGLLEVPSSYGNQIHFFRKPPASVVTTRFVQYVRDHPDYKAIDTIREEFEEKFNHLYNKE
jgi:hypothetical protein